METHFAAQPLPSTTTWDTKAINRRSLPDKAVVRWIAGGAAGCRFEDRCCAGFLMMFRFAKSICFCYYKLAFAEFTLCERSSL